MERLLQWLIRSGAGLVMITALAGGTAVTAGAQETATERAVADQEDGVSGAIKAVEYENDSIIVDGRRFRFGAEVEFDGVVLKREDAIERLTPGDVVRIEPGQDYRNTIRAIHTRLQ